MRLRGWAPNTGDGTPWAIGAFACAAVGLVALHPAPLLPLARAFRDLCQRYPLLALGTAHLQPASVALLFILGGSAAVSAAAVAGITCLGARRVTRRLDSLAGPLPPRLADAGIRLGAVHCLVYLDLPTATAFCFGFVRPRIAVTAGLLARVDDEALTAVLAHERHHARRRDPARYVALRALTAAAFMFPVAGAVARRIETRLELAADRAAVAETRPSALGAALLAVLADAAAPMLGAAGLSPTEARIAHLTGEASLPAIPVGSVVATAACAATIAWSVMELGSSGHLVPMVCRFGALAG